MEGENAKICPSCGSQVKEGASFCTSCGAAMATPQEAPAPPPGPPAQQAQPPVPPAQGAVPPPPGTGPEMPVAPMPAAAPVATSKRGKAPIIIGIIGGILVVAGIVVLVLWLAVWRGGGEGGSGDPIALAEKYISSLEKGDADAYFECFEPDFFTAGNGSMLEDMGIDVKEMITASLEMADFNFDSYALELKSEKGNEATVVTTSGNMTVSVMGYDQEIDLADDPLVFEMVKKDGKWYLTGDPSGAIVGSGMDYQDMNLEDMNLDELMPNDLNLQDLEQYLPEGYSLEDLQNMSPEELNQLLEDLMKLMDQIPQGESTGV
jgi:hypothetical protein